MRRARRFANEAAAVTAARRFATTTLADQPRETTETIELLVSELASNCVRHTDSDFEIAIERDGATIRVAATDWGAGTPTKRSPSPTDPSGRGLMMIDLLASAWGVSYERGRGAGKTVWFTTPAQPSVAAAR